MSDTRSCTCHPDEAPKPCQKQYALTHCQADRIAQLEAALQRIDKMEVYEADAAVILWAKIGIMRDIAHAALEDKP